VIMIIIGYEYIVDAMIPILKQQYKR